MSLVPRFNPASILGGDPDPTFGTLLPGYSVGKVIGEGGFCQVRLAVHHLSQRRVAVKVIDRSKLVDPNEAKRMQREIRVMKHLSHQCVIKLFEVVESPRHLFLVMEHAPSGSLLDYVRARKRLPESDACLFFQQIVASLEYCHSREVVHRDIKLENILLDAEQRMKLIDFGLSAFFVPGKRLRVHCGSPSYAAPEIVARKAYEGPPVDVWSLGVVLFAMVAGYLPFHASGGNKQELCNKIMAGQYTAPEWLSAPMKDLLARMLTTDPDKRITFQQVWQHSWVRNGPQWHERGINCYEVAVDASSPGGVRLDEQVAAELDAAGYPRATLAQHLAAGEASHLTASYFLLCEAKAEALRRLRASGSSAGRNRPSTGSSSARGAGGMYSATASGTGGSGQTSASPAKARGAAGESPGRSGASSSRPSTAMGSGYGSSRGRAGEDVATRMAVAV
ncbi:hypothetical protein GPECTOR_22g824 [Gonium pectorale]|uniref:non-specific serine/threonine protein kinase n=1 Tax=Gonium pectorale TaxID=33097 RepID=A0A150GHG6_GONPE|nr:hypothetical protein GPECTOR_22g824 [Gonium pectorale]|eukprot:KXZ49233.1 hypothetical protein GPECTOR_22g824 [Gonium pectorale]